MVIIRHDPVQRTSSIDGRVIEGKAPVVKCSCGEEVLCVRFTNTCSCGIDFNGSGQRLAPREQWGEETGETAADILAADFEDPWDDL